MIAGTPIVQSWSEAVSAVVVSVAAVVALYQVIVSLHGNRLMRTFQVDESLDEIDSTRLEIEDLFDRGQTPVPIPAADVRAALANKPALERALRTVLGRYEMFCLPIVAGASSDEVSFELSGSSVIWYGQAFKLYIEELRTTLQAPSLYVYLEYVSDRWAKRKVKNAEQFSKTGKPYFARSRWQRWQLARVLRR